jgi:RNA methyltransferase, TrmH family
MASRITSVHNDRVKYIRALGHRRVRQREGRFAIEGTRLADEVVRAGIRPALVLYTEAWAKTPEGIRLLPTLAEALDGAWLASDEVLATCADTTTPQGVIVVVPCLELSPRPGLTLVLDGLRDPGNLGTILRSAEASDVGQVLLSPGTVDVYNPKVVRAAMGAHFRLPIARVSWSAITERTKGRAVWLADAHGQVAYDGVDWTLPSALIVGSEATGASPEAADLATGRVCIPMAEGTDSLNAAMAAAVILFEAARQVRNSQDTCGAPLPGQPGAGTQRHRTVALTAGDSS